MLIDITGSHLMEGVVEHCSRYMRHLIFDRHMAGKLQTLSLNPCANYTIQKLLSRMTDKARLDSVLHELRPHARKLFDSSRAGVIARWRRGAQPDRPARQVPAGDVGDAEAPHRHRRQPL